MKKYSTHTPGEIACKLEKIAAIRSAGEFIAGACRGVRVSPVRFHRWKNSYGSLRRQGVKCFGKL